MSSYLFSTPNEEVAKKLFGPFIEFLKKGVRLDSSRFLSDVAISEDDNGNIWVEFRGVYGPVGYGEGSPDFKMLDYCFRYVFGRDGSYVGRGSTPLNYKGAKLIPFCTTLPSFRDFPFGESSNGNDTLIDEVFRLIERVSEYIHGSPICSIQIKTLGHTFKCSQQTKSTVKYRATLSGGDLLDGFTDRSSPRTSISLSKTIPNELDCVLWFYDEHPQERRILLECAPKEW